MIERPDWIPDDIWATLTPEEQMTAVKGGIVFKNNTFSRYSDPHIEAELAALRGALVAAESYVEMDARKKKYPLAIEVLGKIRAALEMSGGVK